jgi:hypothetical protein
LSDDGDGGGDAHRVRLTAVARAEDRACYFYSRVIDARKAEIRWISHHFTPKSEDETVDFELVELVRSLGTTGDSREAG